MQSRFVLMEGATVALAILLMSLALAISVGIRSEFSTGMQALQRQIALQSQMRAAFDAAVLAFWRCYGSNDSSLLTEYKEASGHLRILSKDTINSAARGEGRTDAEGLAALLGSFLELTDRLLAGPQSSHADEKEFNEISQLTLAVHKAFSATEAKQFEMLQRDTHSVTLYTRLLGILLLGLGLFPVGVMVWFGRAHERHIWKPLDSVHQMVLQVRSGNLDIRGDIPSTVELGSVTTALVKMASELREMRDSLEEKVRQRAKQLEAAQKDVLRAAKLASLGQLVSGVAHEINNPLTSILGFSEIALSSGNMSASTKPQIETIRTEALRLKHLVANLSQFGRRAPQHLHRIDLRAVPDRLLELRSYQLAANNIRVSYERPETPIWIKGDRDALLQMLMQLVLNAERAIRDTQETGEIRVSCSVEKESAFLQIRDTGCGMSAEMTEHIFDPFFTTRQTNSGGGLGLSICHGIVEQHGGEITLESQVGSGTTFVIKLPLAPVKEAGNRANSAEHCGPAPNASMRGSECALPHRLLVIDDEPEILALVKEALNKPSVTVSALQDSTKLETVLETGPFDAVLCDLKMPGRDGLAVLKKLRTDHPDLASHFVLMTGNLADADKAREELKGVPILPKPFTLERLRSALGSLSCIKRPPVTM